MFSPVVASGWHAVRVPRFEPFSALRFSSPELDDLIAPPYDVLSDDDVAALAARHPGNIVHVDVPRPADDPERYERAGALLREWRAQGVMVSDERPSFTIYRMSFTDAAGSVRQIVGVLGGLEVGPYGPGGVLAHERITPKASTDRLDLTRATEANLSPIWGLSLADGLTVALDAPAELVGEVEVDGVTHRVERVDDTERVDEIAAIVGSADVLIADGHHRYGVAQRYLDEAHREDLPTAAGAETTLAFVGELIPEQLSVEAIHRLYRTDAPEALRAALAERFDLAPIEVEPDGVLAWMNQSGALVLVGADGSFTAMTPKPGAFDDVRALDGLWLETALDGVPGVEVAYQHGVVEVLDALRRGTADAAVLIRPVSVAEIRRTATEGLLMPPKSTFFTPKLRTGLVVRPLTLSTDEIMALTRGD